MEPTKQAGADAYYNPAQHHDGPSWRPPLRSPLVEHIAPPPPPPLHLPLMQQGTPLPLIPSSDIDIWDYTMPRPDAQSSSIPKFVNRQYQPSASDSHPGGATAPFFASGQNTNLSPYAPAFVPLTEPHAKQRASGWASMPSSSASGPQPQLGAAGAFSRRGHNASLDSNAFARQAAPLPNQAGGSQLPSFVGTSRTPPHPALVMFPEISERERLVTMLDQGDEDLRLWVLDAVLRDVHTVMGSDAGSAVFRALLRAVVRAGQFEELENIVDAAASPFNKSLLMGVANRKPGETSLKELFRVVAQIDGLCVPLFNCLVDGWIMEQSNGPELLRHFFTTLDYYYCSIFIRRLALPRFSSMVTSKFGWRCMLECVENARHDARYNDLPDIEQAIFSRTIGIAKSQYGTCFLQEVLRSGRYIRLVARIRRQVERNLHDLSTHRFGNYVVQACYVRVLGEPDPPLLRRCLNAFHDLPDAQLVELVHDRSGSRLLGKLLNAGKDMEPPSPWTSTVALARRIERVLGAARDRASARQVMQVVRKVLFGQQQR